MNPMALTVDQVIAKSSLAGPHQNILIHQLQQLAVAKPVSLA